MNTSNDVLNDIRNQLDQLLTLITKQQKDINKIQKWVTAKEKQLKPIPCSAVITSPAETYEYGEVTIHVDAPTWTKIKNGDVLTIKGQGWRFDELDEDEPIQDHWIFNEDKSGSVKVKMEDEDEPGWWSTAFSGHLKECDIEEAPVQAKNVGVVRCNHLGYRSPTPLKVAAQIF